MFDAAWRERAAREQEAALPDGSSLLTCSAPLGGGGLGRHMREILDALERLGREHEHIGEARSSPPADPRREVELTRRTLLRPLTRFSPAWRLWSASDAFDRAATARLVPADNLIGFNGTSIRQFRRAASAGIGAVSLVSATAHMREVIAQHARAHRQYPIERPWATRLLRRNLAEYARAERLYVSSDYVARSFLERGFDPARLVRFSLTPDECFRPADGPRPDTFDVVYVGGLTVDKGVPLLLDAFARLTHADLRLVLVGGWKTRAMRQRVQAAVAGDGRVRVEPGDPLAALQSAGVYVHPTYTDGFGYAPAEALACGAPVLVSEDTGMSELVREGRTGRVLPTGDVSALADAIDAAYRGELLGR